MSQGPKDPAERRTWVQRIRDQYNDQGYTSHLLFRSAGGSGVSGKVHQDVEGAADLLLCPKEVISLDAPPDRWREDVSDDVIGKLRELVDRDSLWQRAG
ncbi:hypothetical protein MKK55_09770 [Methylobacterium sp. J-059]|uniref:hypothetical protein n=1 Tax=Methylobacterium sp. J-059 TaxID=2836643 RepID=UPI001FB8A388|nr:hypothetical protein [Methylobacterium sp. J-059]MCJ2039227.1 hypothetical protein [Methylobacterium sp. J-059]